MNISKSFDNTIVGSEEPENAQVTVKLFIFAVTVLIFRFINGITVHGD